MKCSEAHELQSAYIDGALSDELRSRLERHLRECQACATELEDLRRTAALVRSLGDVEPPAEFRAALRQRLQELAERGRPADRAPAAQWWRAWSSVPIRSAVAAALVLIITFAGGIGVGYRLVQGRVGAPAAQNVTRGEAGPATLGAPAGAAPGASAGAAAKGETGGQPAAPGGEGTGGAQDNGVKMGVAAADRSGAAMDSPGAAAERGQKIIRNGSIELAVSDAAAAQQKVAQITTANGGYVENSSYQQVSAKAARARLALRIPAAQLDAVMAEVEKLGQVRTKVTTATDVNGAYTDAEARLKNLQLQEERLRELLVRAATVDEVLRIENELSRVRTDIDVAVATLKNLQSGVEMATLTVSLEQDPGAVATGTGRPFWDRVRGAFGNTLRALGRLLVDLAIFIGGALPVLAILAVIWLLVRPQRWFRRG